MIPPPPTFDETEAAGFDGTLRTSPFTTVIRWKRAIVDGYGHHARSPYVERFWLPVIGPTATLMLRRFALELGEKDTVQINLTDMALSMGLTHRADKVTPFGRALTRLEMFQLAATSPRNDDELFIATTVTTVPARFLARMPLSVQWEHGELYATAD